jgi:hypothetical protein
MDAEAHEFRLCARTRTGQSIVSVNNNTLTRKC